MTPGNFQQLANFIWSVADLLRGPYGPPQYERVMLPLTALRRFDAVLAPTREAVRYKQEFDRYISEKGYPIKSLVAFCGVVEDDKVPEKTYTEVEMDCGLKEKELSETFARPDYRVLLVAENYQIGFDQPLLHTMYVDKRLSEIQAAQTLSRLNLTHPLKDDTFVLDFVNDPDEIQEVASLFIEPMELNEELFTD